MALRKAVAYHLGKAPDPNHPDKPPLVYELWRSLGTKDQGEATRRYPDKIKEIHAILDAARRGEGPRDPNPAITLSVKQRHALAALWYRRELHHSGENPGDPERHEGVLFDLGEKETQNREREAVKWDVDRLLEVEGLRITAENREELDYLIFLKKIELCKALIRRAKGDWSPDPEIANAPEWVSPKVKAPPTAAQTFATIFAAWVAERKPDDRTKDRWERRWNQLKAHVGHDDPSKVSKADVIGWKDALVARGLLAKTINDDTLTAVNTIFRWAAENLKVAANPAQGVRVDSGKAQKPPKLPYTNEEAKTVLEASRKETGLLRWVPWLEAFSGARVAEIVECGVADVREADGVHYLNIEADAAAGKGTKTESSNRLVPLHASVIAEGFLDYVASLPKDGPLFPDVTPDKYGRRGANGSRTVARWVRGKVKLTDPRKAPNHAWRHWFISACRAVGVTEEARDRIVGQKNGKASEGRNYGVYELKALAAEVAKVVSPVP